MSFAFVENYQRIRKQMFPQCQPQPVVIPVKALPKPAPKPIRRDIIDIQSKQFSQNKIVYNFAPAYMPPGGDWHIKERAKAEDEMCHIVRKSQRQIIKEVCDQYEVTMLDMFSPRRHKDIITPRHLAMWRLRYETQLSLPRIGQLFKRDHTSVLHACKRISKMVEAGEINV